MFLWPWRHSGDSHSFHGPFVSGVGMGDVGEKRDAAGKFYEEMMGRACSLLLGGQGVGPISSVQIGGSESRDGVGSKEDCRIRSAGPGHLA